MDYSKELGRIRASKKMSQGGMAEEIGISQQVFSLAETGKAKKIDPKIVEYVTRIRVEKDKGKNKKATIKYNGGDVEDVERELNRLIELSIKHEATLDVLRVSIESILADLKGKSIALVSEEVQQAIKLRTDRLFDEFEKKR